MTIDLLNNKSVLAMRLRTLAAILHDLVVIALAWQLSYFFRFNFDIPPGFQSAMWSYLLWVVPLQGLVFQGLGLYRGVWRFASIPDLKRISVAVCVAALLTASALAVTNRLEDVPRSVLLLNPVFLVLMMGGSRFLYRAWKDGHLLTPSQLGAEPAIVMGAGSAAALLLRELARGSAWRIVSLLDDDPSKRGLRLLNVSVSGGLADVEDCARRTGATHAIIAMPGASLTQKRRATELAVAAGLKVFVLPAISDVLDGKVSVSQMRRIELEDLLGREAVKLDSLGIQSLLTSRTVIVTGGGGSIGSELCRQIAAFRPTQLVCYDISEYAVYALQEEFARAFPEIALVGIVGDVKDEALLIRVFEHYRPDVVFHAAAYKHVPLMETNNTWTAVRNNVLGTLRVARAAMRVGASEFVLISTDKAVNPTNVMGATKRLAERVCQAIQDEGDTRVVMVRFGNVLGSSGSVIPKFREQLAKGGPLTVTHAEITRYFMLIPEACQLVLQAGQLANASRERGRIFVLDMGEPVKIIDLARDMIRLSGFSEDEIKIEITGLRPGEKLYEELLADSEATLPTPHPSLRIAYPEELPDAVWLSEIEAWLQHPMYADDEVKSRLQHYVPEYKPASH